MSPPPNPPPNAQPLLAQPLVFELQLTKPSGVGIGDAEVQIQWDDDPSQYQNLPQVQTIKTDIGGRAHVPVLDPLSWLAPDKANGTTGTIRVSKEHHGPIVPYGTSFADGPGSAQIRYKPGAAPGQGTLSIDGLTPTQEVLWGRPRVIGPNQNILHMMLVEGGLLGVEHPTVRTRRLSAPHRPATPPTPVSQIDEELLFHIAHGGLALDPATDFKFKIVQQAQPDGSFKPVHQLDLPPAPTGTFPTVPKLNIRNAVAGGVRMLHILQFQPNRTPAAGYDLSGLADSRTMNPRLVVGIVRLCRVLAALGVRTMITVGFNRSGDTKFHGPGRAVDFSGAIMDHVIPMKDPANPAITDLTDPHVSAKIKPQWQNTTVSGQTITVFQRDCVAAIDLIVEFHWGGVQLLVDTGTLPNVRRNEDHKRYQRLGNTAPNEKLLYRLSAVPLAAERATQHVLTDAHYSVAGTVFHAAYQFFATEFSHRDALLGPLPTVPPGLAANLAANLAIANAALDDAPPAPPPAPPLAAGPVAAPTEPGTIAGFVLHPDYPEPDTIGTSTAPRRETHRNHIHANLGNRVGQPDSES